MPKIRHYSYWRVHIDEKLLEYNMITDDGTWFAHDKFETTLYNDGKLFEDGEIPCIINNLSRRCLLL